MISESAVIEIIYSGVIHREDLQGALNECGTRSQKAGSLKFLADCTMMTGGHSLFDLHEIITLFEKAKIDHTMKEAIIFGPHSPMLDNIMFYETSCRNRGYNVRLFGEREKALSGLVK
jgi:hypothetical protein